MLIHKQCEICIHMESAHCICGGEWIDNFCWADKSVEDACSSPKEYLTLLSRKSGRDFSFWVGDLISSREWHEYFYEELDTDKKYFSSIPKEYQNHLISNSKEFNQPIIEVAVEIEDGILVCFFIEDDEASLLKRLRKSIEIMSSE